MLEILEFGEQDERDSLVFGTGKFKIDEYIKGINIFWRIDFKR